MKSEYTKVVFINDEKLGSSNQFDQYEYQRRIVQLEINKDCHKPFSFEVYKKTLAEKIELANAKAKWKAEQRNLDSL